MDQNCVNKTRAETAKHCQSCLQKAADVSVLAFSNRLSLLQKTAFWDKEKSSFENAPKFNNA